MKTLMFALLALTACNGCGPKPIQKVSSSNCTKWIFEAGKEPVCVDKK